MRLSSKPVIKLSAITKIIDRRIRDHFMEIFFDFEQTFGNDVLLGTDNFIKIASKQYILSCLYTLQKEARQNIITRGLNEKDTGDLIENAILKVIRNIPKNTFIEVDKQVYDS